MIRIEKPLTKGFNASIAYTKSLAGNISDGDGDQALALTRVHNRFMV